MTPLDPSGEDARDLLREELADPEYYEDDLLQRLLDWIARQLDRGIGAAADVPPLQAFAAIVVGLALVAGVVLVISRVRRNPQSGSAGVGPVLGGERVSADELRRRAEEALERGEQATAISEAYRALGVRQIERGVIAERPQATAGELARAIALAHPDHASGVRAAAGVFDEVVYGDRAGDAHAARTILDLEEALRRAVPVSGTMSSTMSSTAGALR